MKEFFSIFEKLYNKDIVTDIFEKFKSVPSAMHKNLKYCFLFKNVCSVFVRTCVAIETRYC